MLQMAGGRGFPHARLDWRGRQAMVHAIAQQGGRVELEALENLVFEPWREDYEAREDRGREADWAPHLERLRSATGSRASDFDLLAAWFGPYGEQLIPFDGAARALQELQEMNLKLAVVSNVPLPGELYANVLARHGLRQFLHQLFFSYDFGSRKPSPAILRHAMVAVTVDPERTVMVGDRRDRDIAAGRSAGARTVWVRSQDGGGPDADASVGALAELPMLLEQWRR